MDNVETGSVSSLFSFFFFFALGPMRWNGKKEERKLLIAVWRKSVDLEKEFFIFFFLSYSIRNLFLKSIRSILLLA